MTPGRRWRARRDQVIRAARASGVSTALIADVFDLSRSRVLEILAAETGRGGVAPGPPAADGCAENLTEKPGAPATPVGGLDP